MCLKRIRSWFRKEKAVPRPALTEEPVSDRTLLDEEHHTAGEAEALKSLLTPIKDLDKKRTARNAPDARRPSRKRKSPTTKRR